MPWIDRKDKPKGKNLVKKKRYASTPKPCAIVHNPSGQLVDFDDHGNPDPHAPQYHEFPSRSAGKKALAKIINALPKKKHPSDPPLYSVENV